MGWSLFICVYCQWDHYQSINKALKVGWSLLICVYCQWDHYQSINKALKVGWSLLCLFSSRVESKFSKSLSENESMVLFCLKEKSFQLPWNPWGETITFIRFFNMLMCSVCDAGQRSLQQWRGMLTCWCVVCVMQRWREMLTCWCVVCVMQGKGHCSSEERC